LGLHESRRWPDPDGNYRGDSPDSSVSRDGAAHTSGPSLEQKEYVSKINTVTELQTRKRCPRGAPTNIKERNPDAINDKRPGVGAPSLSSNNLILLRKRQHKT